MQLVIMYTDYYYKIAYWHARRPLISLFVDIQYRRKQQ